MSDRDIWNIFQSISKCMEEKHIKLFKERLIFVDWSLEKEETSTRSLEFENGKRIEMTWVKTNDYLGIYEAIKEIKPKFSPKVIRELKKEIYKLAETSNPSSILVATGFENMDKLDKNKNFVVSIGISEKYGLPVEADDIYKDIIFDDRTISSELVVNIYLPKLLKTNSGGLPTYKYLKNFNGNIPEIILEKIKEHSNLSNFLNIFLKKQKESEDLAYKKIYFLEKDEINIIDLENYLQKIIKEKKVSLKNNSELKRLIRIYDYLKFK